MKKEFGMIKFTYWIVFLSLIFTGISHTDDNALLRRIDQNIMPQNYESYRKMIDIEPGGKKKEYIVYTVKSGKDKVVMLFLSPASEKGRSTLRLGENMWLYIPNVGKPIRITSLQSITGSIFNNADIMRLDYSVEYNTVKTVKLGAEYALELKAKNKSVAYDTLKMWADENEIVSKIECYSASGMLIKTLEFKEKKDFGDGVSRPSVIETHSPLYKGYKSFMIYSNIKTRVFGDEVFTINFMSKIESLRK